MNNVNKKNSRLAYFIIMGFRENLKAELEYQDILVKELAEQTGISRHTLDNYLNIRERMPTADIAVKIAQVLGVSVEYLVMGEEKPEDTSVFGRELRVLIQNYRELSEYDRKMLLAIAQLFKKLEKKRIQ